MNFYPYFSPIILTDTIFINYGGHLGNSTPFQRQVAYQIAEEKVSEHLETFLLPTIVTGTYTYVETQQLILEHTFVHRVIKTELLDEKLTVYWSQDGTANIYVHLTNDQRGLVNIDYVVANCNCHSHGGYRPYQIRLTYETGLYSGTSYQPDTLLALTTYADLILQEIIGYGNEAPGDIGVQSYRNQQYQEERVKLLRTDFGTSARAQFANRLLSRLRKRRFVGLGL